MNTHDAQSSLDGIRRLQDRTHNELVRQYFVLPQVATSLLVVFLVFASFDFPEPWATAARVLGCAVAGGALIVQHRRSSVRRTPTDRELVLYAGWGAVT